MPSVSWLLSQLLNLTPYKFQRSLWWVCLNVGTQPSAWIIAAPAHQECVKCWPSSHIGVQNTRMVIYYHSLLFWRTLFRQSFVQQVYLVTIVLLKVFQTLLPIRLQLTRNTRLLSFLQQLVLNQSGWNVRKLSILKFVDKRRNSIGSIYSTWWV